MILPIRNDPPQPLGRPGDRRSHFSGPRRRHAFFHPAELVDVFMSVARL